MLNVPGSTPGAVLGEAHELALPVCSLPVCVWTKGPLLAIENPVMVEKSDPAAGAAPARATTTAARAMRVLTTRLRLECELAGRAHRCASHVVAVHDLSRAQRLALGELLPHRLREREADLRSLARGDGERLRPECRLAQLDRVRAGAAHDRRRR